MRIVITILDGSGAELSGVSYTAPDDGTALDKHLENAAAEAKNLVIRAGVASLKSRGKPGEIVVLERKVAFWRNLYIEDECPDEDQIAAFDEAAAEPETQ